MDKNFRDVPGGMSISEARAATTSADQYFIPEGNIRNVGQIDTSKPIISDSGHPTYLGGLPGDGVGTFSNEINARPFMAQNGRKLTGGPEDIRSLSMNHQLGQGVIDEPLLRAIYGERGSASPELLAALAGTSGLAATVYPWEAPEIPAEQRGSDYHGTITPPRHPNLLKLSNALARANRSLEGSVGELASREALETVLRKWSYNQEPTGWEKAFALMDLAP